MTRRLLAAGLAPWAGLFGGLLAWFGAHELGFYLVRVNCAGRPWVVPAIHALALLLAAGCGLISFRAPSRPPMREHAFATTIGIGAASLFAVAILWQGVASLIYTGCER